MQTTAITVFALAVAGSAFAAGAEPKHDPKAKAAAAKEDSPDPRTVTVTTTVHKNGASANQVSFAAAALAGAMAFASYIIPTTGAQIQKCQKGSMFGASRRLDAVHSCGTEKQPPLVTRTLKGLGVNLEESSMAVKRVVIVLALFGGCAAYLLSTV
ncbi:hypothetical protein LPJ72_002366 [Coemansia sp. Benny D160-2]|nr:hypothetical protein LPJ72_002366 [Coemansia sp. Benny D160-2]